MNDRPFLLVIAGPNGSGKSTLTDYLIDAGVDFGKYINPDQIAATLDMREPERSRQAQAIADLRRNSCLASGLSFSFETVMSHPSKVELMVRAHDAGYDVTVFFVCTSDPDINVRRVENRVRRGGHDVPRGRIVARYWRSLELLLSAALVANRVVLFDNSALVGYRENSLLPNPKTGLRPVAEIIRDGRSYRLDLESTVPEWVFISLVRPFEELALRSDGAVSLTIDQKDGLLGSAGDSHEP